MKRCLAPKVGILDVGTNLEVCKAHRSTNAGLKTLSWLGGRIYLSDDRDVRDDSSVETILRKQIQQRKDNENLGKSYLIIRAAADSTYGILQSLELNVVTRAARVETF